MGYKSCHFSDYKAFPKVELSWCKVPPARRAAHSTSARVLGITVMYAELGAEVVIFGIEFLGHLRSSRTSGGTLYQGWELRAKFRKHHRSSKAHGGTWNECSERCWNFVPGLELGPSSEAIIAVPKLSVKLEMQVRNYASWLGTCGQVPK